MKTDQVIELKKALASAVTANRTDDMKRILLRLRQELTATEEIIRVSYSLPGNIRALAEDLVVLCAGYEDWSLCRQAQDERKQGDFRAGKGHCQEGQLSFCALASLILRDSDSGRTMLDHEARLKVLSQLQPVGLALSFSLSSSSVCLVFFSRSIFWRFQRFASGCAQ